MQENIHRSTDGETGQKANIIQMRQAQRDLDAVVDIRNKARKRRRGSAYPLIRFVSRDVLCYVEVRGDKPLLLRASSRRTYTSIYFWGHRCTDPRL